MNTRQWEEQFEPKMIHYEAVEAMGLRRKDLTQCKKLSVLFSEKICANAKKSVDAAIFRALIAHELRRIFRGSHNKKNQQ